MWEETSLELLHALGFFRLRLSLPCPVSFSRRQRFDFVIGVFLYLKCFPNFNLGHAVTQESAEQASSVTLFWPGNSHVRACKILYRNSWKTGSRRNPALERLFAVWWFKASSASRSPTYIARHGSQQTPRPAQRRGGLTLPPPLPRYWRPLSKRQKHFIQRSRIHWLKEYQPTLSLQCTEKWKGDEGKLIQSCMLLYCQFRFQPTSISVHAFFFLLAVPYLWPSAKNCTGRIIRFLV